GASKPSTGVLETPARSTAALTIAVFRTSRREITAKSLWESVRLAARVASRLLADDLLIELEGAGNIIRFARCVRHFVRLLESILPELGPIAGADLERLRQQRHLSLIQTRQLLAGDRQDERAAWALADLHRWHIGGCRDSLAELGENPLIE